MLIWPPENAGNPISADLYFKYFPRKVVTRGERHRLSICRILGKYFLREDAPGTPLCKIMYLPHNIKPFCLYETTFSTVQKDERGIPLMI